MDYVCNFDGACFPHNPGGHAVAGWIIRDSRGNAVVRRSAHIVSGKAASSNVAEHAALTRVLLWLRSSAPKGSRILIRGDSLMTIRQMRGSSRVLGGLYKEYAMENIKILCTMNDFWITFEHVPREKNKEADALSNDRSVVPSRSSRGTSVGGSVPRHRPIAYPPRRVAGAVSLPHDISGLPVTKLPPGPRPGPWRSRTPGPRPFSPPVSSAPLVVVRRRSLPSKKDLTPKKSML